MNKDMSVVIEQDPMNLCGELTKWQGPHLASWIKWPALGISMLHSIVPITPKAPVNHS